MINNNELINQIKSYNRFLNSASLTKAYNFALEAHQNQKREEGVPYIIHPVAVAKIFKADATKLSEHLRKNSVEAITCDPPYGQSSTTSDKNLRNLFRSFMNEAHKVLKKKGRLVIIIPSKLKIPGLIPKEFKRLGKFDWYVHGGLTRQIVVLEK